MRAHPYYAARNVGPVQSHHNDTLSGTNHPDREKVRHELYTPLKRVLHMCQ